jgi:hypothetical protein
MKHLTTQQQNRENLNFLKEKYFDLILHFLKRKDLKSVDQLQQSWKEVEALWKSY